MSGEEMRYFREQERLRNDKDKILDLSTPLVERERIVKIYRYFYEYAGYMAQITDPDPIRRELALEPPPPTPLENGGREEAVRRYDAGIREAKAVHDAVIERGPKTMNDLNRISEACRHLDLLREQECESGWKWVRVPGTGAPTCNGLEIGPWNARGGPLARRTPLEENAPSDPARAARPGTVRHRPAKAA